MSRLRAPLMLTPARIEWRGAQPYAPEFDDIYFSPDAADEVRRVFWQPSELLAQGSDLLTVGELGFGTGLNFAVCAENILRQSHKRLHFISVEAHPLGYLDWQHVVRLWRHKLPIYQELADHPLPLLEGWHRRVLAAGRITLSLFHGSVDTALTPIGSRTTTADRCLVVGRFCP